MPIVIMDYIRADWCKAFITAKYQHKNETFSTTISLEELKWKWYTSIPKVFIKHATDAEMNQCENVINDSCYKLN